MPTIKFACPNCGQGELEARLGSVEQFSAPVVDKPAEWAEITRRRQEYIGAQVMGAILVHVVYEGCPAVPLEDCRHQQPGYDWRCNRAADHKGDHEHQVDHPTGVRTVARWPRLELVQ